MRRLFPYAALAALGVTTAGVASETLVYVYDAKGRLVRVERSGSVNNSVQATYVRDKADNRTNLQVIGSTTAGPGVVINPSFELPNVGAGFQYGPAVDGAFFGTSAGVAGNGSAWAFTPAPAGNQVGFIQSNAGDASIIVANVSGLVPGVRYIVKYHAARRLSYAPNTLAVAFQGIALGLQTPASTPFQQITTQSFVAQSSVGALSFLGTTGGDSATGIDAITITPEP